MERNSLFGEISLKFGSSPEDLATEALLYILRQHSEAWPALHRLFSRTEIKLPIDLTLRSQVSGKDQAQPDLIGTDAEGDPALIVEAKFWAGLSYPDKAARYSWWFLAFFNFQKVPSS